MAAAIRFFKALSATSDGIFPGIILAIESMPHILQMGYQNLLELLQVTKGEHPLVLVNWIGNFPSVISPILTASNCRNQEVRKYKRCVQMT